MENIESQGEHRVEDEEQHVEQVAQAAEAILAAGVEGEHEIYDSVGLDDEKTMRSVWARVEDKLGATSNSRLYLGTQKVEGTDRTISTFESQTSNPEVKLITREMYEQERLMRMYLYLDKGRAGGEIRG